MDGKRFDELTRAIAGGRSRRSFLRSVAASALAGAAAVVGAGRADAAKCRKPGDICRKDAECCSDTCGPLDATRRRRCQCAAAADCPAPKSACLSPICAGGACQTVDTCTGGQVCFSRACCTPDPKPTTCLNKTGSVKNNCGQRVDCGNCLAAPAACTTNGQCCSGVCVGGTCQAGQHPAGGTCDDTADCQAGLRCCSGNCRACCSPADCPGTDTECATKTCTSGVCGTTFTENTTPTTAQTAGDCKRTQCNGAGAIVSVTDDSDTPAPTNGCSTGTCTNGVPSQTPKPSGSACAESGGTVCNGSGACVQCLTPSQCPGQETACSSRTCTNGTCGTSYVPNNTLTTSQTPGDCQKVVCDGQGGTKTVNDDDDAPTATGQCVTATCSNGVPTQTPKQRGAACAESGGTVCDGEGACVECIGDAMCAGGDTCCAGTCVDTQTDLDNCGTCANVCADGQTCDSGTCVGDPDDDCDPGEMCCENECIDPQTDPNHCGTCDTACGADQDCCAGICKDTQSDVENCGGCDNYCDPLQSCCSGTCTYLDDDQNCGGCGNSCSDGQSCCGGGCKDIQSDIDNCGACDYPCDPGQSCCSGMCVDTASDELNCGGCDFPCSSGESCCDSFCYDTSGDYFNCGTCGNICEGDNAACCGGFCKDLNSDPDNCAGCGNVCSSGQDCCGAVCQNIKSDIENCGGCGNVCSTSGCEGGTCCATPSDGSYLCSNGPCCSGYSQINEGSYCYCYDFNFNGN